jgi:hypothetical protein
MRFLIREQEFETPIASGRFQYEKEGQPAGVIESWRLTEVINDYSFLRIDLDKRESDQEQSILFHVVLNPAGKPERVKARLISMESSMLSDISIQEQSALLTGEINGKRFEDEKKYGSNTIFWFRTVIGYGLLARNSGIDKKPLGLEFNFRKVSLMNQKIAITEIGTSEVLDKGHGNFVVRPYLISWNNKRKRVWLDDGNWPIKMDFGNNLMATDTQPIRYR